MKMKWTFKTIDWLLYSNVWIATCAAAMTLQTKYILTKQSQCDALALFVFCATLALYGLHRIVGMKKIKPFQNTGRFYTIHQQRLVISCCTLAAIVLGAITFFGLSRGSQLALSIPALISLAYSLPIFKQKRRLRDVNGIKIFLIASVWSWITVGLVVTEYQITWNRILLYLLLERFFFILAIAIPFDIRDIEIDQYHRIATLPNRLGEKNSKWLALSCLGIMLFFSFSLWQFGAYRHTQFYSLLLTTTFSGAVIWNPFQVKHDYYYAGVVDGLMLLQSLAIL